MRRTLKGFLEEYCRELSGLDTTSLRKLVATAEGNARYRMCKDLGLNPGNVYAYLAGDDAKVSKETARRMLVYAEG